MLYNVEYFTAFSNYCLIFSKKKKGGGGGGGLSSIFLFEFHQPLPRSTFLRKVTRCKNTFVLGGTVLKGV